MSPSPSNPVTNTFTHSRRTEGVTYICRGPGALLSLPCGGVREDVIHKRNFRESIWDNVNRWFNWSRNIGLPVNRMDDLILVTGCTLVTSYALAVFDDHDTRDAQVSLASTPRYHNHSCQPMYSTVGFVTCKTAECVFVFPILAVVTPRFFERTDKLRWI